MQACKQTDRQSYNHAYNKVGRGMKADAGRHVRREQVYKYTSHLSLFLFHVNRNPRISPISIHIAYLLPRGKLFLAKHAFVTLYADVTIYHCHGNDVLPASISCRSERRTMHNATFTLFFSI